MFVIAVRESDTRSPSATCVNFPLRAARIRRLEARFDKLHTSLLSRKFKSPRAEEYARQGLGRRLDEMNRAIDFIFDILPPEQEEPPRGGQPRGYHHAPAVVFHERAGMPTTLRGFGSMKLTRETRTEAS